MRQCCNEISNFNELEIGALNCREANCCSKEHREQLDNVCRHIVNGLKNGARLAFPTQCTCSTGSYNNNICNTGRCQVVPGWNNYVREAHAAARESFLIFQQDGKPCHEGMRHSRQQFIYALRRCRRVESQARTDPLAKHLPSKIYSSF